MKKLIARIHSLKYRQKLIISCIIVGIVPLSIMAVYCYRQTMRLLLDQEYAALDSASGVAVSSIDSQIALYEDLLNYLSFSEPVIMTPIQDSSKILETYEQLNYKFDVFLNGIYVQHPEILQITVYNAMSDLTHGNQLRPVSDLEAQSWYTADAVTARPSWYRNEDGTICVIQKIPDPFSRYIESYSDNYVAISLNPTTLFQVLEDISTDYHLSVSTPLQSMYTFQSSSISGQVPGKGNWTTISRNTARHFWQIVLEKPTFLLYKSTSHMVLFNILIIVVCLVLLLITSRFFSRFFVRRIDLLHNSMQEVRGGNLAIRIYDSLPDEIGALTNNFQEMLDEINRLIRENYENKLLLKETQLKTLQAQINPHFLYNCLSLINSKALMNKQPEISQMSQRLSTFYRTTLNRGKSETTLPNEIENMKSYVDIQKLLHDNAFDVVYQIDGQLPEIKVPNLLLQPLVENALIHGILPNKSRYGRLFLAISKVMEHIRFTILDNGVGIPAQKLTGLLQTDSGGYGLKNVHERLQLTYGEEYGLTINSIPGESTMITFTIPL
ncbi:MAG: sensor histidine kinase [Lachnospiraceae bacterium]|jgi:two-component system sensor histidine kinase YesM|nr:sensor histidine kinase [uncultured Acetatifactor sp.]MCI9220145.1 sensor histidine kinase [Lachnospiraceae bacterium]